MLATENRMRPRVKRILAIALPVVGRQIRTIRVHGPILVALLGLVVHFQPTIVLHELANRFLDWVNKARLEEKTRKFYRNGWRLLKPTSVAMLRVDQVTGDFAEQLKFPGSSANANCALRTLRRMLHTSEEWKLISHTPKIKMMKEHGRRLRLDDEAERKLTMGALACNWRPRTCDLFRDIVVLMRDTGMRNERELFRMRIENLDWQNRVIFVPDSKTAEGRRLVPMSGRVFEIMRNRCTERQEGWVFPSKRSASGHLRSICNLFRKERNKAGFPKELVLYYARHDYGTRVPMRTGNLAAVMRTMGHRDVKTAMHYQHPEMEIVRAALDYRSPNSEVHKGLRHLLRHTKKPKSRQVIDHLAIRRRPGLLAG